MVTTWTNVLNGAATTVGATPGDAVPATALNDVLQISNSGNGLDTTLRDVVDGDGDTIPMQVSKQAVMLPDGVVWPYGDSTFFSAGKCGVMVPYYLYPNNPYTDPTVTRLLGLIRQYRGKVPCIVIINPGSGPGSVVDGNYSAFIKLIKAAGGLVAGYVSTAYAGTINSSRTEAAVKADVDTWLTLYANTPIDTIFFDEQNWDPGPLNSYVALYKRYTDYCHARNLAPTIANPGTNQREEWFAERTADIIVVVESGTWPSESDMLGAFVGGHIDYKTSLRCALMYGQSSVTNENIRTLARYVQWVYPTEDALSPNPWDSLSAHLEQTFAALAGPVPNAGSAGQVLTKSSSTDFHVAWTTPASSYASRLYTGTASVGTPASAAETDLQTYSLPASTLASTGQTIRIIASGINAANPAAKTIKLYFGAAALTLSTSSSTSTIWRLEASVTRTGSNAQRVIGTLWNGPTSGSLATINLVTNTTLTQTDTSAITIKATGASAGAAANDVTCNYLSVEFLP